MQPDLFTLYPEISLFDQGYLQVSDIHSIYYERCGNPTGIPVVFLHGGPGSGCNARQRRFFDPAHYHIILFDQRGCGRSTPLGATAENTTDYLTQDIDTLRKHLGIQKWLVFGGSWGSTLGLCYAITFPENVTGLILRGIFLSRPTELHWFLGEVRAFFPESWETLCAYLPSAARENPILAYEKRIFNDSPQVSIPAAIRWNAFESSIMSLFPGTPSADSPDGEVELARARVQIHYIQHHCFVGMRDLLAEAKQKLSHIPTVIIQGRYDMVCPPTTAWELKQAMPHAEFVMVPDAGHSAMEPGITHALITATEHFKHRVTY